MAVKPGYNQTQAGFFPEKWDEINLAEHSTLKARIGWQGLTTAEYLSTGKFRLITGTDFLDGKVNWDGCHFVEKCRYDQDINIQVAVGDVLVTKDGTIGKIAYIDQLPGPATLNSGIFVIRPKNEKYNSLYFFYILSSSFFNDFLLQLQAGSTINHLYQKDFVNFNFPAPPLEEQRAIAAALSDVDALLAALDALIAKKRLIKQGAMQELLTGQRRLPGFSGEWETKKLLDECTLVTKGTTPTSLGKDFVNQGINFVKIESIAGDGKILKDKLAYIDEETNRLLGRSQLQDKDILFSIAGALGRTAVVYKDLLPANTNQALAIIRLKPQSELTHDYLIGFLRSHIITKHIDLINVQAAQANLSLENIRDFEIRCPSKLEQTAIAEILSDMDAEIQALEGRRTKTRLLKQGMMQELLTGRIRLI